MRCCKIGESRPPTTRLAAPQVVQLDFPAMPVRVDDVPVVSVKVETDPDVPSAFASTGAGGPVKVEKDEDELKDESSTSSELPLPPDEDDDEDLSPGPAAEDPYLNTAVDGPYLKHI